MTLAQLLLTIKNGFRLILGVTIFAAILAAAITIIRPAVYEARTTLLVTPPASQAQSEGGGRLAAALLQQSSPLRVLEGVMTSRTAQTRVWKSLDVTEDDLKIISSTDPTTNQFVIITRAGTPDLALKGSETSIAVLANLRRELDVSRAGLQAAELKKALDAKLIDLKTLEDKALAYQMGAKTAVDPTDPGTVVAYKKQAQELKAELSGVEKELAKLGSAASAAQRTMNSYAANVPGFETLRQNVAETELELKAVEQKYQGDATKLREARARAKSAKDSLNAELTKYLTSVRSGLNPSVATLEARRAGLIVQIETLDQLALYAPGEALELLRLQRDLETLNEVYARLKVGYESALVEEKVANTWWSILDAPYLMPKAINKSLGMSILLASFAAAALTVLFLTARATLRAESESSDAVA